MKKNNIQSNKGAALLIAVLMSAVVLVVGVGVYQRTYKEVVFGSMWKQTQIAFGAADSGLECAVYSELHNTQNCFGLAITWPPPASGEDIFIGSSCVNVRMTKTSGVGGMVTIEARGYNDTCGSTNPRRVERGLKISWQNP